MTDQYITLLSTYNCDIFQNNNSASFRNLMPRELQFESNAEVSLVEISFLHDFIINPKQPAGVTLFDFKFKNEKGYYGKFYEFDLEHKLINNPIDLCNQLNDFILMKVKRLKESKRQIFTFESNKRIWINFEPTDFILLILKAGVLPIVGAIETPMTGVAIIVGKNKQELYFTEDGKEYYFASNCRQVYHSFCEKRDFFQFPPRLGLVQEFLVLSSIATETPVANHLVKLLRFVTTDSDHSGKRVNVTFNNRMYVPLAENNITQIEIQLKSLDNQLLSLQGLCRVILHIRDQKKDDCRTTNST